MAETWEDILAPFIAARGGTLGSSWDSELEWIDDPMALDGLEENGVMTEAERIESRRLTTLDAPDVLDVDESSGEFSTLRRAGALESIISRGPGPASPGGRPAQGILSIDSPFSLSDWTSSFENARIPEKALTAVEGTEFLMEPHAAVALRNMIDAARKDGINLVIGNTYRDWAAQASAYSAYVAGEKSAPVAEPGTSNHGWGLAVDLASIESGGPEFAWLRKNAGSFGFSNPWVEGPQDTDSVEPWHWEYAQTDVGDVKGGFTAPVKRGTRVKQTPIQHNQALAPLSLLSGVPAFASVMDSLFSPDTYVTEKVMSENPTGGSVEQQLRRGFIDSGRPDLARMVGTKDFEVWVRAESGWRPDVVSKYFEGHGVNYGLFQFWEGHQWTQEYVENGKFTASPYEQARLVARYFGHLTPDRIREYADQVRNGDYKGWG